ncbi:MAG: 1-acyl-sn-glycerol-3-phosphate acyltransferase [Propionibacteriaceae bacterium]|nr:1-acyl-sn-glycerol-3-phosphate acyltransferase [Propionibacteriaceae bacterium]
MLYTVVKYLLKFLVFILFWPIYRGKENFPATGPAVIAGNHLGAGEAIMVLASSPVQVTFPGKKELFRTDTLVHRFVAWFLKAIHQVPIDRTGGQAATEGLEQVLTVLDRGDFVSILPEGHRSPDGRLYKGRTGVARIALASGAPIIPFGCFNTRFVKKWLPFPWMYRPEIRIGEPFSIDPEIREAYLTSTDYDETHRILRQTTDEIMRRIQEITGQEMVDEYSYNPKKHKPHS